MGKGRTQFEIKHDDGFDFLNVVWAVVPEAKSSAFAAEIGGG